MSPGSVRPVPIPISPCQAIRASNYCRIISSFGTWSRWSCRCAGDGFFNLEITVVTWERRGGYEVSSKGDKRFSAFNAVLADGRSIEEHYQCDVKGYDLGGRQWRLGKGKPALDSSKDLWTEYLALWRQWAVLNPQLFEGLCKHIGPDGVLSDRFAHTCVNQARALAVLANEHFA